MYYQKELETMPKDELRSLQLKRLNETLLRAAKSPYYGNILKKTLDAGGLKSLDAVKDLPCTGKQDLRDHFPYGMLTMPLDDVVRLHSSSGTTGNPTVVFHTKNDLDNWSTLVARSMYMTGLRKTDVFQNMMGYGLFTGGLGFHYGAEKLGCMTIPSGPGNSKRQLWFIKTFNVTALHILPSYAMRLYSFFEEAGVDPKKDTSLKRAFVGAEPHTEALRREIEKLYGIKAYNSYGLSEMAGPGIAFECPEQNGLHLWEDQYYPEIINPETGELVPEGEEGELVITTLCREAMPLIRYRTRDLTRFIPGECPCGRTHRRLERIKGRSDDMFIINGVNIFPMQIEKTIMDIPEVGTHYIIELRKEDYLDRIFLKIEINKELFKGSLPELENVQHKISELLKSELGVNPRVIFVEPGSLPESEGKVKRVHDLRNEA